MFCETPHLTVLQRRCSYAAANSDSVPAEKTDVSDSSQTPSFAFYYPGPIWRSGDWIKSLLLFFDGVALLVPNYMTERPEFLDPSLATPLREQGLLKILEPESLVDKEATAALGDGLAELISSGAFDELAKEDTAFHELSYSRLGGYGDEAIAQSILRDLKKRGLARDTEDGVSIPMHPLVRSTILTFLAQILRQKGPSLGIDLCPATDQRRLVDSLVEVLSLPDAPSAGHVVSLDLATVGVDLRTEPLDDVLRFRDEYGAEFRKYARDIRNTTRELSLLSTRERETVMSDRLESITDEAELLGQVSRDWWKKPASCGIAATGAVWSAATGDLWGALIAGVGLVGAIGLTGGATAEAGAFSYLFKAQSRFG